MALNLSSHVLRDFLKNKKGNLSIMAAIILPVGLAAAGLAIDTSKMIASKAALQNAADAAALAAASALANKGVTASEAETLATDFINRSTLDYPMIDRAKLQVTVADDTKNPDQFTVALAYDASSLPIWNLYSFAMPGSQIKHFSTIRLGGI